MLRTIAFAVLIGFVSTAAVAQQPKPSPSPAGPAPGTTAYTTRYIDALENANGKYESLSSDPNANPKALAQAYSDAVQAYWNAETALRQEADNTAEVKAAARERDAAMSTYERFADDPKNYGNISEEKRLEKARNAAIAKFVATRNRKADEIAKSRYPGLFQLPKLDSRLAPKKNAEPDKKQSSDKTSCAPGTGLAGITENLACQEQHSGAGH